MGKDVLYVQMLGTFALTYKGKAISFERNNATKTNQLLQLLIHAGDKGISREHLTETLFGREGITNPSTSLRTTVFRLRKLLARELPESDYIRIQGGFYFWDNEIPAEVDARKFQETANQALACTDEETRYQLLKDACFLYRGDFLPHISSEEWVVLASVQYRNLYFRCLRELSQRMKQDHEYVTLYRLVSLAAEMYPFEEWQVEQIDCLIAANREREAMEVYNATSQMLFRELGTQPSERLKERFRTMRAHCQNQEQKLEDIREMLESSDEQEGAYYCGYPSFAETYRFIRRVINRSGQTAYLMLVTITDGKGIPLENGERADHLAEELKAAIASALRKGDLYTQYGANQFLLLLMEIKKEDFDTVIKRINGNFERPSRKNYLKYSYDSIVDIKKKEPEFHFHSEHFIWK